MQNSVVVPAQPGQYDINGQTTGECLQSANHLTYTQYVNVCTGKQYNVPMGFWDIAMWIGVGIMMVIAFGFVSLGIKSIFD